MITLQDTKDGLHWLLQGITPNRIILILLLALCFDVLFSDTYSSKQNYIQILKQSEKLESDPTDFKRADIEGLYGICRDIRFEISKEVTQSEVEQAKLDEGCALISDIFHKLPQPRFDRINHE